MRLMSLSVESSNDPNLLVVDGGSDFVSIETFPKWRCCIVISAAFITFK